MDEARNGAAGVEREVAGQPQAIGQPQVIVVAPQALPGYGQGYSQSTSPGIPAQWQWLLLRVSSR